MSGFVAKAGNVQRGGAAPPPSLTRAQVGRLAVTILPELFPNKHL
jgi:hypothetical protein